MSGVFFAQNITRRISPFNMSSRTWLYLHKVSLGAKARCEDLCHFIRNSSVLARKQ